MNEHETQIPAPAWKTVAVLPIHTDPPPLRLAEEGDIRVGNGRISLDLVVEEHEDGTSPEEMVLAYEALNLAEVYGAIAYDLRHKDEVRLPQGTPDPQVLAWSAAENRVLISNDRKTTIN